MMRASLVLVAAVLLGAGGGCRPQCHEANDCLEPNQCNGAPNLQRYPMRSGLYTITQSDVGLDGCLTGRHSGDFNGLMVQLTADEAAESVAVRIASDLDLGSGKRNPQPSCNSASLSKSGVPGNITGCQFMAAFSSQLILLADGEFYLSITEEHTDLSSSCPVQGKSCTLLYGATAR